jgi:hypothetical protein
VCSAPASYDPGFNVNCSGCAWGAAEASSSGEFVWDDSQFGEPVMATPYVCSQPAAGAVLSPETAAMLGDGAGYTYPAIGQTSLRYIPPYAAPVPLSLPAIPQVPAAEDLVW